MKIKVSKVATWILYAAVAIWLLFMVSSNCTGQSIPLISGTIDSADVVEKRNTIEQFQLFGIFVAKSDSLLIHFNKRKWERKHTLTYLVDSLDIITLSDVEEEIILYLFQESGEDPTYARIIYDYENFKLWIYFRKHTFYYTGKVS